jgi:hypothetical protein
MAATRTVTKKAAPAKTAKPPRQRRAQQRVQVDERLQTMSAEALTCRSWGHAPLLLPVPAPEAVKHRRMGQKLVLIGCRNQCGYHRRVVLDGGSKEVISDHTKYDDPRSYLVQKRGTGRVRRRESRNAFFALVAGD